MSNKGAEPPISDEHHIGQSKVSHAASPMQFVVSDALWQKAERYFNAKKNRHAIKLRGRDIPGIAFPKKPKSPTPTGQPDADKKAKEAYQIELQNYKKEKANYPSFLKIDGKIYAYSPLIGQGGMGKIKKAINRAGGQFALKILQARENKSEEENATHLQQLEIMRKIGYLKGYAVRSMEGEGKEKQYYVTELRKGHDLAKELYEDLEERAIHKPVSEKERLFIALNSCVAIKDLHDLNVIHCDIKPDNFMYESGRVKTIDFDLAKQLPKEQDFVDLSKIQGTDPYVAPEIEGNLTSNTARYSYASDVYALGMMFKKDLKLDHTTMISFDPKKRPTLNSVIENLCKELRKQPFLTPTEKDMLHLAECSLITVRVDPIMKPATLFSKASIDWKATFTKAHEETAAGKIVKFPPVVHEALNQRMKRYKTSKAKKEDEITKNLQKLIKKRDDIIKNLKTPPKAPPAPFSIATKKPTLTHELVTAEGSLQDVRQHVQAQPDSQLRVAEDDHLIKNIEQPTFYPQKATAYQMSDANNPNRIFTHEPPAKDKVIYSISKKQKGTDKQYEDTIREACRLAVTSAKPYSKIDITNTRSSLKQQVAAYLAEEIAKQIAAKQFTMQSAPVVITIGPRIIPSLHK